MSRRRSVRRRSIPSWYWLRAGVFTGALLLLMATGVFFSRRLLGKSQEALTANSATPAATSMGEPLTAEAVANPVVEAQPTANTEPISAMPAVATSPTAVAVPGDETAAPAITGVPPGANIYPQNISNRPVPRVGAQPWTISEDWLAQHKRQLQSTKRTQAKVVFLGDSIVRGWGMAPVYREQFAKYSPANLGIDGEYTQNLLWRIDQGALDGMHAELAVILIGINNLSGGFTPEQTVSGVSAVIGAVRAHLPGARILVLSLLPAKQSRTDPLRQKITETNRLLAKLSQPGRVSIHDVGSVLLEPDGTISKETLRDFVHPTPAGYERLTKAVLPFMEELMVL